MYLFLLLAMIFSTSIACANYLVVTSDQITVSSEGIFITIDGFPIEIESLNTANDGYIVAVPKPNAAICPNCEHDTYTPGRFCLRCGFPYNGKK